VAAELVLAQLAYSIEVELADLGNKVAEQEPHNNIEVEQELLLELAEVVPASSFVAVAELAVDIVAG
jgi:hypothetical protein